GRRDDADSREVVDELAAVPVVVPRRQEAEEVREEGVDRVRVRAVVPELVVEAEVPPLVVPLVAVDGRRDDLARRGTEVTLPAERRVLEVLVGAEEILDLGARRAARGVCRGRVPAVRVVPRGVRDGRALSGDGEQVLRHAGERTYLGRLARGG